MLAVLALLLTTCAQEAAPPSVLRLDRSEDLAAGASVRFEHVTRHYGLLSVWAESSELDLLLRVQRPDGSALEDDDTGGARNPRLRIPCDALEQR